MERNSAFLKDSSVDTAYVRTTFSLICIAIERFIVPSGHLAFSFCYSLSERASEGLASIVIKKKPLLDLPMFDPLLDLVLKFPSGLE